MKRSNLNRKQQEDGVATEVEVGAEQTKAANGGGSKQPQIPSAEPGESASVTNQTSSNTTAETTQMNQRNQPQILVNSRLNLNKRARLMSESSASNTIGGGNDFHSASTRRIHQFMGGKWKEKCLQFLAERNFAIQFTITIFCNTILY